MEKYIIIVLALSLLLLACVKKSIKKHPFEDKICLCDSYKYFQEVNETKTQIIVDSFCLDIRATNLYKAVVTNNSDSTIVLITQKNRYDSIHYLQFLYRRYYIDSFNCHRSRSFTYYENFETNHKIHFINPGEKLQVFGNNWMEGQNELENLCFLYFEYYPSIHRWKIDKSAYSGTYFERKENQMLKIK